MVLRVLVYLQHGTGRKKSPGLGKVQPTRGSKRRKARKAESHMQRDVEKQGRQRFQHLALFQAHTTGGCLSQGDQNMLKVVALSYEVAPEQQRKLNECLDLFH